MVMKNNLLRFASLLALFVFPSLVARADDAADYKQGFIRSISRRLM